MTRLSKVTENNRANSQKVQNFMEGTSYKINPIDTLRIVAASSIFGEPQYYREGGVKPESWSMQRDTSRAADIFKDIFGTQTVTEVFTIAIDNALAYDFKSTLDLAALLRSEYYMRLNPAVIFIRASIHPNRIAFNESNPGYMKAIGKKIALRPDDLTNQLDYYLYINKTKNKLSTIVKKNLVR